MAQVLVELVEQPLEPVSCDDLNSHAVRLAGSDGGFTAACAAGAEDASDLPVVATAARRGVVLIRSLAAGGVPRRRAQALLAQRGSDRRARARQPRSDGADRQPELLCDAGVVEPCSLVEFERFSLGARQRVEHLT